MPLKTLRGIFLFTNLLSDFSYLWYGRRRKGHYNGGNRIGGKRVGYAKLQIATIHVDKDRASQ
jgi:hypothetical protein